MYLGTFAFFKTMCWFHLVEAINGVDSISAAHEYVPWIRHIWSLGSKWFLYLLAVYIKKSKQEQEAYFDSVLQLKFRFVMLQFSLIG